MYGPSDPSGRSLSRFPLVHRKVIPALNSPVAIFTPGWNRGTVRVKCLAQEHNTVSPARSAKRVCV